MQHAALPCLNDWRHHHDIAQAANRLFNDDAGQLRFPALGGAFEEHASINVIGKKLWWLRSDPSGIGHLRDFSEDLCTGVATAHHQDFFSRKRLGVNVMGRMQLLTGKGFAAWVMRQVGMAPSAGRADHGAGQPTAALGFYVEVITPTFNSVDPVGPCDRKLVALLILAQVIEYVVATGVTVSDRRHHPTGDGTPGRR
ncbi:hypothetical protein D3C81_1255980 [compost metagenome]